MTQVYITIDTEYSARMHARLGVGGRAENFRKSILGAVEGRAVGVAYQLDTFDRHGLKAVFFVDPMPAMVWGVEAITDIVGPIVERGHDVQLHLHSEWLKFAGANNPIGARTGDNIKDFEQDEQCVLLDYALKTLMAAGAPRPVAFRAGNYGANDATLRALAELGLKYDTSHCPGIAVSQCAISLGAKDRSPMDYCGVVEVPIGCIESFRGWKRHAQITALSAAELLAAVAFAHRTQSGPVTVVSHSFELLSRDRTRINPFLKRRFEMVCAGLEKMEGVETATYAAAPPVVETRAAPAPILPPNLLREGLRIAEQALGNALYGAK